MTKLVSLMVPTRKRVQKLHESIESLKNTVKNPNDIELIVRMDDDDPETFEYIRSAKHNIDIVCLTGSRGRGYADLHTYYNQMCSVAKGRFLFLWNDDATMLTQNWDEQLKQHDDGKACYVKSGVQDTRGRDQFLFPIVHRSYYDILGHFSESAHNDTYVYSVFMGYPSAFRHTDIIVQHHALQLEDETALEGKKMWPTTKGVWDKPEIYEKIKVDATKLGELLKQQA